ncbi:MAG: energy transducer TonB [Desulfobacterota bacterium]|jgi:TonB family protein|nr:energy transducer TonB [Thermodesulfobacteriota bacterium]
MALRIIKAATEASVHQTERILRICVMVSLAFHVAMVLALQNAIPIDLTGDDLRVYRVELLRPPVDDLDLSEKPDTDISKPEEPAAPKTASDETQETISLDTDDKRYVTYAQAIKERIAGQWKYPQEARKKKLEGRLVALFSLNRDGDLTRMEITRSSGHEVLDREAERAVQSAAPFPPFPSTITVSRLNVNVSFDYTLSKKK